MSLPRVYPIVDNAEWIAQLGPVGVRLVQLRLKGQPQVTVAAQIRRAQGLCASFGIQLIVNAHWQRSRAAGCDFGHLGQGDLQGADLGALRRAGVRLGISTHDEHELERALALAPDYGAGPIYHTTLKVMPWAPRGLARLGQWRRRVRRAAARGHRRRDARAAAGGVCGGCRRCRQSSATFSARRIRRRAPGSGSRRGCLKGPAPMSDRYARQTVLPQIGAAGQARLAQAHVLVAGAGGLGCALMPLPRSRCRPPRRFRSRSSRCQPAPPAVVSHGRPGRPKAQAARAALLALNPLISVTAHCERLTPANVAASVAGADVAIDAADSLALTYMLSDACREAGKPLVSAQVLGLAGYVGVFCGGAPSYRAVFPDMPPLAGNCAQNGVLGTAVGVMGTLQAHLTLALLLGLTPSPRGRLISIDFQALHFGGFGFSGASEPAQGSLTFIAVLTHRARCGHRSAQRDRGARIAGERRAAPDVRLGTRTAPEPGRSARGAAPQRVRARRAARRCGARLRQPALRWRSGKKRGPRHRRV
jgi:thiamine-phosphate diphosphorylase